MDEKLYIEEPTFEKVARRYLNEDPTKWVKDIIETFLERYPFFQDQPVVIEWKRKDTRKGYAIGVLKVINGQVPVIVRDFMLYPMDIFVYNGVYLPLTEETVAMLMETPEAFDGLATQRYLGETSIFSPELTDTSFSPTDVGRYGTYPGLSVVRPAEKYASVMEQITHVDKDKVREVVDSITKDANLRRNFEANDTIDILQKLASKPSTSPTREIDTYLRNLDIDRQYVYRDDRGNHFLKQANSSINKTWTTRISQDEVKDYPILLKKADKSKKLEKISATLPILDSDKYLEIDSNMNWTVSRDFDIEKTAKFDKLSEQNPSRGDFGVFFGDNGVTEPFDVVNIRASHQRDKNIEKVASFNLKNSPGQSIVIDEKNNWEIVDSVNEKTASLNEETGNFNQKDYKLGDFGIFLTKEGALGPIDIRKVNKIKNLPYDYVSGLNGFEKISVYLLNKGAGEGIKKHESDRHGFYIDKTAQFIPLKESSTKLSDTWNRRQKELGDVIVDADFGYKTAEFHISGRKNGTEIDKLSETKFLVPADAKFVKLSKKIEKTAEVNRKQHYIGKDVSGLYYLKGREFEKYAEVGHKIRDIGRDDAIWALIHCGAERGDIKKTADLNENQIHPLDSNVKAPREVNTIYKKANQKFQELKGEIELLTHDLVKHASLLEDKGSVDAILALNLINKQNVVEFIDAIPTFELVMTNLAKLLLMSRVGLAEAPSDVIKQAMDKLTTVVLVLRRIRSNMKEIK